MDNYLIKGETLTDIANAIRSKTGGTDDIKAKDMASSIQSITTGTDTSDATATADEIFAGKTAYVADGKVTGGFTIDSELTEQDDLISQINTLVNIKANPPSTDTSDATATASDILSGKTAYVNGSKVTGNIPSKIEATYIPTTSNQTIASGTYLEGTQTIKGDANLIPSNIVSGVSIFGVTGTASGGSGSIETCTVQISVIGPTMESPMVYYTDSNMTVQSSNIRIALSITVAIGTIVLTYGGSLEDEVSGNVERIHYAMGYSSYKISGDSYIELMPM